MPAATAMRLGEIQPDRTTGDLSHLHAIDPGGKSTSVACADSVWPRSDSPNRRVILDRAWARRLGVPRTAGRYRIRSHQLARMLAAPDASTQGGPPAPPQAGALRSLAPR